LVEWKDWGGKILIRQKQGAQRSCKGRLKKGRKGEYSFPKKKKIGIT